MSSPISGTAQAPTPWSTGSGASCSSSPEREGGPRRVGRDGFLRLHFERRGARTVLTERRFSLPLQALEPMYLDQSGAATLMLLNPTGGLLQGDVLETSVTLGPGGRVCLATPAAPRVYRSSGPPAIQRLSARVGESAVLEYLPDHLILSPGARLRQHVEITLAPFAVALLLDAWAVGRAARGEGWRFHELDSGTVVRDDRGLLLKERFVLGGEGRWAGLGAAEGMAYVASFCALAPWRDRWDDLAHELDASLRAAPEAVHGGVTPLGRGGLMARLLAPSAPSLQRCVETLWARCRLRLLGSPPLSLRKL